MKLKISPLRTIVSFLLAFLFLGVALFFMCWTIFFDFPWDFRQPLIIGLWVVSGIVFLILSLTQNYYILSKKYVTVKRYTKELIYYFADVIYIDEEKSTKKKMIHFYTRQGHPRYLNFDRKGILYQTMLEKCENRMSKEEFERTHPDVKL
ncbi:MAG: hypothetical protein IJQ67_07375 [Bacilli bacterium]|nr:hypothetical protein [Bacilli bacterium]